MLGQFSFHTHNTPASVYDANAQTFFTNAGITDDTEKTLWNNFVVGSKLDNTYGKLKTFHPLMGSNLTTKSYNAINTSVSQVTWFGCANSSVGVDCDGGNGYFLLSGGLSATNSGAGICIYDYSDIPYDMWHLYLFEDGGYGLYLAVEKRSSPANAIYNATEWNAALFNSVNDYSNGLLAIQSTNQSPDKIRLYNGDQHAYVEGSSDTVTTGINAISFGDCNGTGSSYNTICCLFTSEGLTESEMIALKNRIYTLMSGLGRIV